VHTLTAGQRKIGQSVSGRSRLLLALLLLVVVIIAIIVILIFVDLHLLRLEESLDVGEDEPLEMLVTQAQLTLGDDFVEAEDEEVLDDVLLPLCVQLAPGCHVGAVAVVAEEAVPLLLVVGVGQRQLVELDVIAGEVAFLEELVGGLPLLRSHVWQL